MAFYSRVHLWDYYRDGYCRNMGKIMSKQFFVAYHWHDFNNTEELTSFQKYRIKTRCKMALKEIVQEVIDESIKAKKSRRSELKAHSDPNNPFKLDIGGEG